MQVINKIIKETQDREKNYANQNRLFKELKVGE